MTALWLYVQSYFRRQKEFNLFAAGKTVTVVVPVAPRCDVSLGSAIAFWSR